MWHDTEMTTNLQNGENVPTLALHKYLKSPISQWPDGEYSSVTSGMPCFGAVEHLTASTMAEFLDNAGVERFLAKAVRFQSDLAQTGANQSLYQGIMGALGYAKNKLPFRELARRLPLQVLESLTQSEISGEECLARQQALLLGTAGLLPSQHRDKCQGNKSGDEWVDKLEELWVASRHPKAMSRDDWNLCKVRPHNSPVRRLAAMGYLILRYRGKGTLERIIKMIKAMPVNKGTSGLEKGLVITAEGYWASHFDLGLESKVKSPTLLGSGRAADIAVNVLLPFALAWSKLTSQPGLERKVFDLYHGHPRLEANTVEQHMTAQLGLDSCLIKSARRQQGLIHIYHTLCTQGRCNSCCLSELEAGNHIQI